MKPVKTMIREISAIAVEAGLVNADWPATLRVKIRKGDGGAWGGMKNNAPWINVCAAHDWSYKPHANTDVYFRRWTNNARKGPKRTRMLGRLAKVKSGLAVLAEYASIEVDKPVLGVITGGKPLDARMELIGLPLFEAAA